MKTLQKWCKFILLYIFLLTICVLNIIAADNPATNITISYPATVTLQSRGEALLNLEFKLPLGYFIFVKNIRASSNKVVEFSFSGNSGLNIKNVGMPDGKEFKNDLILSNKGTFQLIIEDKIGLRPGSTVNVPLNINLQVGTTKTTFAAYILQKTISFKIEGGPGPVKTVPPPPPKPTTPPTPTPAPVQIPDLNEIIWLHDYDTGFAEAKIKNKMMLLYFTSLGKCDVCRWMEKNTFAQPEVIRLIANGFIAVKIPDKLNGRTNPDTKKFKINAYPTVIIANNNGVAIYNKWMKITSNELIKDIKGYAKMEPVATQHPVPVIEDTPLKKIQKNLAGVLHIKANDVIYFLKNGTYVEYRFHTNKINSGFPKDINENDWKGLSAYKNKIMTALNWEKEIVHIFLTDGNYLRINLRTRAIDEGYPKEINNRTWPGLLPFRNKLVGAIQGKDDKIYFFLSTGEYMQYDMKNNGMDRGYPKPINNRTWPGLEPYAKNIIAATTLDSASAYFYLNNGEVIRFNLARNTVEPDNEKSIP